jgi:hypothetical protein
MAGGSARPDIPVVRYFGEHGVIQPYSMPVFQGFFDFSAADTLRKVTPDNELLKRCLKVGSGVTLLERILCTLEDRW